MANGAYGENDQPIENQSGAYGVNDTPADAPETKSSILRTALADKAVGFAGGAVGATKALSDAFGAGNTVSDTLGETGKNIDSYLSPEAKADQRRQSDRTRQAEGTGPLNEFKAGLQNFAESPIQKTVSGLGSVVPTALAAIGGLPAAAAAGVGMGLGTIKGRVYDDTKQRGLEAGLSDADASANADSAQAYSGGNLDQIALGGGLGALDSLTGVSRIAGGMLRNAVMKPAISAIPAAVERGLISRAAMGALGEVPLEAAQGGQEQLATNIAAQRQGVNTDTWSGVVGQATDEGLASLGSGAAFGAMNRAPRATSPAPQPTVADVNSANADLGQSVDEYLGQPAAPLQLESNRVIAVPRQDGMGMAPIDRDAGPLSAAAADAQESGLTEAMANQVGPLLKSYATPAEAEAEMMQREDADRLEIGRHPRATDRYSVLPKSALKLEAQDAKASLAAQKAQAAEQKQMETLAANETRTQQAEQEDGNAMPVGAENAATTIERALLDSEQNSAPSLANTASSATESVADTVDEAAHNAATSDLNDRPQPTDAQKSAGNYSKGHIRVGGLNMAIENPVGSTRSGTDTSGKPWTVTMGDHYGYIKATTGNDKDQVDTFVKRGTSTAHAGPVFVVDQVDPATGRFDEHKALIGYANEAEATAAYKANYAKGWTGMKAVTAMSMDQFKAWVKDGPKRLPASEDARVQEVQAAAQATATQNAPQAAQAVAEEAAQAEVAQSTGKQSTPRLERIAGETNEAYLARRAAAVNAKRASAVQTESIPTQSKDTAAAIEALGTKATGKEAAVPMSEMPDQTEAKDGEISKQSAAFINHVSKLFGKRVVFVSGMSADGMRTAGNVIYLSTQSSVAHLRVLGHEMLHALKAQNAKSYNHMMDAVKGLLTDKEYAAQYKDYYGKDVPEGAELSASEKAFLAEEWMADLSGNRFAEEGFWKDVFTQVEAKHGTEAAKSIVGKLRLALVNALQKLMKLVNGPQFNVDARVADHLDEIRKAIGEGFAEYAMAVKSGQVTSEDGSGVEAKFAPRKPIDVGGFKTQQFKDGSMLVMGDTAAIRAMLPDGVVGRVTNSGLQFTHSDAPRVRHSLEGNKTAYSRSGEVTETSFRTADGKYLGAPEKFNTPGKIPHLRKWLMKLTKEGEAGRFWYENSSKAILHMVGGDKTEARKFAALLAIYSPQAKVDTNGTFALRAWAQDKAGQPINVKTGVMDSKAKAALDNVDEFWSGEKTGNFVTNLLRVIDPHLAQGATIDMWMMRAAQYSNDAPTKTQYAFMENETNRIARELGWEPQQVQAAIWVAMKARMENEGVKKAVEAKSEKKGWIHYEYPLKNGKPQKTRKIDNEQAHRDNWLDQSLAYDPSTSDTQRAKFDFEDSLRRHIGQVSWEARPGRSTGVLPGVNDAPYAQQVEFQQAVQRALQGAEGEDLLAQKLGLLVDGDDVLAPGVWQGEVAAGMQKQIAMAPAKGDDGKTSLDSTQKQALDTYSAVLGLLLRQEGVGWHRPFYNGKAAGENGVELRIGKPFTPEQAKELWAAIDSRMRAKGVADWEQGAGMISSPVGMRVVNFGALEDNKAFRDLVKDAVSDVDVNAHGATFTSDGNLVTNDWKGSPNGQDFVLAISDSGRSDLLGWSRDVLAPRVQSVFDEYSKKYNWGDPGAIKFSTQRGRPDDIGDRGGSAEGERSAPRYGQGISGAVSVTGYHFSKQPRASLNGNYYGTGLKGLEAQRLAGSENADIRPRVFFYVDTGSGVRAEDGVGGNGHRVQLENVYDVIKDDLGIVKRNPGANNWERAVKDAGFDGYLIQEPRAAQGFAVLIGPKHSAVPVQPYSPTGYSAPQATPEPYKRALMGKELSKLDMDALQAAAPSAKLRMGNLTLDVAELPAARAELAKQGIELPDNAPKMSEKRAQTDSPAFKKWFGENSTMVNEDGSPMVLYHGTTKANERSLGVFRRSKIGAMGPAIYLGDSKEASAGYADGAMMEVYARGKYLNNRQWTEYVNKSGWAGAEQAARADGFSGVYDSMFENAIAVWDSQDIKSATKNNGKFDPANPDIRFSEKRTEPFYSALSQEVSKLKMQTAPAFGWRDAIKGLVNKGQVKAEEIEWSGLNDWLELQTGKVTRDQVVQYLDANGVKVTETTLGSAKTSIDRVNREIEPEGYTAYEDKIDESVYFIDPDGDVQDYADLPEYIQNMVAKADSTAKSGPAKFGQYVVPGGENYREVLLTLPENTTGEVPAGWRLIDVAEEDRAEGFAVPLEESGPWRFKGPGVSSRQYKTRTEALAALKREVGDSPTGRYTSTHWDQKNVLAHLRLDDRTDADGNKVLFVQEVQSDWGQQAKKDGLKPAQGGIAKSMQSLLDRAEVTEMPDLDKVAVVLPTGERFSGRTKDDAMAAARRAIADREQPGVPNGPFIGRTEGWLNLALKRVIKMAVDGGYDKVAFANGQQSADHYDLSKQISEIKYNVTGDSNYHLEIQDKRGSNIPVPRSMDADGLEQHVGKEIAQKIVDTATSEHKMLRGLSLKVGGEGMKTFYDKIVPIAAGKLAAKLGGGKVESVAFSTWSTEKNSDGEWDVYAPNGELETVKESKESADAFIKKQKVDGPIAQPGFTITDKMREAAAGGLPMFSNKRQTNTPEFKKWFGDSKVVDADGKPLVVMHASPEERSTFDTGEFRARYTVSPDAMGAWFTADQRLIDRIHEIRSEESDHDNYDPETDSTKPYSGVTQQVFLSIKNPKVAKTRAEMDSWVEPGSNTEELKRQLVAKGFDGVRVLDDYGHGESWVAFSPEQIKSATGNNGDFDGTNPDIRFSPARQFDIPLASSFDDVVYKMQDKLIDTKRVIEAITKSAGKISDSINVYLQEELFHGRAAKRVADFGSQELKPLMGHMRLAGLDIEAVEEYLHARHAKEANALIASREPSMPDGGSGMTNKAAADYMEALAPAQRVKLEGVAKKVDAILAKTRQTYADYGLESQQTVDAWGSMFKHYIPLMREDKDGGMGIGQGFSVKGKETKGRTGSTRKVVDILANIAMQRERAIVRGEKNRVGQALLGLAQANPNPDFWTVRSQAPTERVYDAKTNKVVDRPDMMFKQRDSVLGAKVKDSKGNVVEQFVEFNESDDRAKRMAVALKNLDANSLEGLLGVSAKITRYFSSVNTQYNPVFGVVNLIRDVQGAMINLGSTPLAGKQAAVAKDTLAALAGIYGDIRQVRKGGVATSKWATLWEQMQADGGTTGYRDLFKTSEDRANALKDELNPDAWMDSKLGKALSANGALKAPLSTAKSGSDALFGWLSDYNEAMENGVRLAAYKAALDAGMSRQQAASLSKNLTVNFNRKGQIGQQAGALYAFFNAAMQGTAKIGQTLFDMDGGDIKTLRLSPLGKKVVYGGMLLGSMQALALAAAGFSDEDPPEFLRERSLIIPTGGKGYVSIPMPLGLHVIPGLGRHATEFALSGFTKPAKRAVSVFGMFADAFNPIGNSGLSIQTIAPTAIDPLVALTENKDWTGKPIARVSSNKALPGHAQWKDTATGWSKLLAEGINAVSGGNQYVAGVLSPTPDQIDYLIAQATGGVGREISKIEQTTKSLVRGEEIPTFKIPLAGRFYGNSASQASEGTQFYANADKLNELETEMKGLRKDGKHAEANALMQSRPEARLIMQVNHAELQVQKLKREKRAIIATGGDRALVRAKEEQITAVMARTNRATERLMEH